MVIEDWIYWGDNPWYAGVIWKDWNMQAHIVCETTCTVQETYIARPTPQIDLETTLIVDEDFQPAASSAVFCATNATAVPYATYPMSADAIACASTVSVSEQVVFDESAAISCTTVADANETFVNRTQPDEISNLQIWYDASYYSSVIDNTDSSPVEVGQGFAKVKEWHDRANSFDLTDGGVSSRQPAWNEDQQNGLPTITFNSIETQEHYLVDLATGGTFGSVGSPYTVLMVTTGSGITTMRWNGTNDPAFTNEHDSTIAVGTLRNATATEAEFVTESNAKWSAVVVDSGLYVRDKDGNSATTSITEVTTPGSGWWIYIGWDYIADDYLPGEVCEILVYNVALSDSDIDDLGDYFTAKWGL